MRRWITVGVALIGLMICGAGTIGAQGGGETGGETTPLPACAAGDLRPLADLAIQMLSATSRASRFDVDEILGWREDLGALELPACAEAEGIWQQLWLAEDELLIGALLLERGGAVEPAAVAINNGLMALTTLRYALNVTGPAGGMLPSGSGGGEPFGSLDGDDVLAAFQRFDLPYTDVVRQAGPAGGSAPQTEAERITFTLPTVFDGGAGQALIFADQAGRDAWTAYLLDPNAASRGYVYIQENVIVQLSPDLDAATAQQFRAALDSLSSAE